MQPAQDVELRPIQPADEAAMEQIIRAALEEFDATEGHAASHVRESQNLHAAHSGPQSEFWVLARGTSILGGGGFGPLPGVPPASRTAELRKMYLRPAARGTGLGRRLLGHLLGRMHSLGYESCYLETAETMTQAQTLYRKYGFERLPQRLGNTGHIRCSVSMMRMPLARGPDLG